MPPSPAPPPPPSPSLPPYVCAWGWMVAGVGGLGGVGGVAAIVGLGAMRWGGVRWGGAGVSRFPLRPAEAMAWWAAMARVDAWRLVQEERQPELDASSGTGSCYHATLYGSLSAADFVQCARPIDRPCAAVLTRSRVNICIHYIRLEYTVFLGVKYGGVVAV